MKNLSLQKINPQGPLRIELSKATNVTPLGRFASTILPLELCTRHISASRPPLHSTLLKITVIELKRILVSSNYTRSIGFNKKKSKIGTGKKIPNFLLSNLKSSKLQVSLYLHNHIFPQRFLIPASIMLILKTRL
jgi:hypothetical protein